MNPAGNPDWRLAPELTEMSVGYPTLAAVAQSFLVGTTGRVYWKFTASSTGRVSIDALLSHFSDPTIQADAEAVEGHGPSVTLTVYDRVYDRVMDRYNLTTLYTETDYYDASGEYFAQGRLLIEVQEGKTYIIGLWTSAGRPYAYLVPRVGNIVGAPEWVQPDDVEVIFSADDPRHHVPAERAPRPPTVHISEVNTLNTTLFVGGTNTVCSWATGFEGKLKIDRAFGGPHPVTEPAAIRCSWNWSRKLWDEALLRYWSKFGGASWNGTDPYNPDVEGYGTCPLLPAIDWNEGTQNFNDWPVGYHYAAISEWPYSDEVYFRVFAISQEVYPLSIVLRAGPFGTGWKMPDTRPLLPTESIDLEGGSTARSRLVDLKMAPNETNAAGSSDVKAWWYSHPERATSVPNEWGPWAGGWQGSTLGPESWAGGQTFMAAYGGGQAAWVDVPAGLWNNYLDLEQAGLTSEFRLTALPSGIFDADPPQELGDLSVLQSTYAFRNMQFASLKATLRPVRYRLWADPGIPDITWEPMGGIDGTPVSAGTVLY